MEKPKDKGYYWVWVKGIVKPVVAELVDDIFVSQSTSQIIPNSQIERSEEINTDPIDK